MAVALFEKMQGNDHNVNLDSDVSHHNRSFSKDVRYLKFCNFFLKKKKKKEKKKSYKK